MHLFKIKTITLLFLLVFKLSVHSQPFQEIALLAPTDGADQDLFGQEIAMHGDYAFITSIGDRSKGSAYVFKYENAVWNELQKLIPDSADAGGSFGSSVALTDKYAIVGFMNDDNQEHDHTGSAMIYKLVNDEWQFDQKIANPAAVYNDRFGISVDIDGEYAIAGSSYESGNGNYGAAYIYHKDDKGWQLQQRLIAGYSNWGEHFGESVAISNGYAFVGAPRKDAAGINSGVVFVYKLDGDNWMQVDELSPSDAGIAYYFGGRMDVSDNVIAISADGAGPSSTERYGHVYIYELDGANWIQKQLIQAHDQVNRDQFGRSVAISCNYLVVGAMYNEEGGFNNGAAYFFKKDRDEYVFDRKTIGSKGGGLMGMAAAVSCDHALVGVSHHNINGPNSGLVYVYGDTASNPAAIRKTDFINYTSIYPNPVTRSLKIIGPTNVTIDIYDTHGRLMLQQTNISQSTEIDCADFPSGMYHIVISQDGIREVKRFLKQ